MNRKIVVALSIIAVICLIVFFFTAGRSTPEFNVFDFEIESEMGVYGDWFYSLTFNLQNIGDGSASNVKILCYAVFADHIAYKADEPNSIGTFKAVKRFSSLSSNQIIDVTFEWSEFTCCSGSVNFRWSRVLYSANISVFCNERPVQTFYFTP